MSTSDSKFPPWVTQLLEDLSGCFELFGLVEHGVRAEENEGTISYEIFIYPALAVVEGTDDLVSPDFRLELGSACNLFDEVQEMLWHPGDNLSVEGLINGTSVAVYFEETPPENAGPAYSLNKDGSYSEITIN